MSWQGDWLCITEMKSPKAGCGKMQLVISRQPSMAGLKSAMLEGYHGVVVISIGPDYYCTQVNFLGFHGICRCVRGGLVKNLVEVRPKATIKVLMLTLFLLTCFYISGSTASSNCIVLYGFNI